MKKFLIAMVMLVMGTNLAFADYNPSDFPSNFVGEWIVNSPQNSVGFVG